MPTQTNPASLPHVPRERIPLARVWQLLRPYWFSEDSWAGRGLLALVVGLNLGGVGLAVLLADWNRQFFDALQVKNYPVFLKLLGEFGLLAALYITVAVYALYFNQMLQIRWRRWLTERYYRDWLSGRAYYLLQLEPSHVENPEQRIQDDIGIVANLLFTAWATLMRWTLTPTMYRPVREKKSIMFPGRPVGKRKFSGLIKTSVRCGFSPAG